MYRNWIRIEEKEIQDKNVLEELLKISSISESSLRLEEKLHFDKISNKEYEAQFNDIKKNYKLDDDTSNINNTELINTYFHEDTSYGMDASIIPAIINDPYMYIRNLKMMFYKTNIEKYSGIYYDNYLNKTPILNNYEIKALHKELFDSNSISNKLEIYFKTGRTFKKTNIYLYIIDI